MNLKALVRSVRRRSLRTVAIFAPWRKSLADDLEQEILAAITVKGIDDLRMARAYSRAIAKPILAGLLADSFDVTIPQQAKAYAKMGRYTDAAVSSMVARDTVDVDEAPNVCDPEAELQDARLDRMRAERMLSALTQPQRGAMYGAMREGRYDEVARLWAHFWPGNKEGPAPDVHAAATLKRGLVPAMAAECGVKRATLHYRLAHGWTVDDAKKNPQRTGLKIGAVFDRVTITREDGRNKHGKRVFVGSCSCGGTARGTEGDFKANRITSCGCKKRERGRERAGALAIAAKAAAEQREAENRVLYEVAR